MKQIILCSLSKKFVFSRILKLTGYKINFWKYFIYEVSLYKQKH